MSDGSACLQPYKQPIMRFEDRLFDRGWVRSAIATRKYGKYLFPEIFYDREEVRKYFCTSVNNDGRFT